MLKAKNVESGDDDGHHNDVPEIELERKKNDDDDYYDV